jgi:hypothetical protein
MDRIEHGERMMTGMDPTFLVGAQRSGTTALGLAFSRAIASVNGCFTVNGKLPYFLRRWWTPPDAEARHLRSDEVAHGLTRIPAQGEEADEWLKRACDAVVASARRASHTKVSIVHEVRRICAEAYGHGPWGDKYNEYLLELPWLHEIFPDARWVFLVREPGEAVASMLAWRHDKPWNPRESAAASAKWAHWTSRWLVFRNSIERWRRIEIDYASLCEGHHDNLSEFLGVDMAPFLTDFRRSSACRPRAPLDPDATEVRARLVRLGLLADSRALPSQPADIHSCAAREWSALERS